MSTISNKKSDATMDDVLALISDFKAGNFSKQLNKTSDPKLKDLVDSLNDVTKILAAQAEIDISERKILEIELLQNQINLDESKTQLAHEKYRLSVILEGTNIGTWEWNIKTGETIFNERWAKIIGYTLEEISPLSIDTWTRFTHPDDLKLSGELLGKHFKGELDYYECEVRMKHKEGHWVWVLDRGKVHKWNEAGEPLLMSGTHQNITEQKILEREKEAILKRLDYALDASGDGIWDWTPADGKTVYSKAWIEMLGYEVGELASLAREWSDRLHPEDIEWVFAAINKITQTPANGDTLNHEYRFSNKAGDYLWILNKVKVVERNEKGEATRVVGTHTNISERKATEAELDQQRSKLSVKSKLESMGEMSAAIAHEINNPLAIISGAVRLLSKFKDNPEKLASKIETIQKSCDRIAKIVIGLKKFSRFDNQTIFLSHDLNDIAKEVVFLTEFKAKRFNTAVTIKSSVQAHILCNEIEIEQVLVNLINNGIDAVKDQPEKWVKISVFEDGPMIVMRVIDSGLGIAKNARAKLFDPFFTTKIVGEGTGLGLSITKGILDDHKATISVLANEPNTCFEIRFPKVDEMKNVS